MKEEISSKMKLSHTKGVIRYILDRQPHNVKILPSQQLRELIRQGCITADEEIEETQIQPASIDLRLGDFAYELSSSFLPRNYTDIFSKVSELQLRIREIDLNEPAVLKANHVYLVQLQEELELPANIEARANPRSTSGRADLFTRLLCDYSNEFEAVPPGYRGKLFVEIVPRTFDICVRKGTRVNQIRLGLVEENGSSYLPPLTTTFNNSSNSTALPELLSVSLMADTESGVVGYIAKPNAPVLDFDKVASHERDDFWEPIFQNHSSSFILEPEAFYILRSLEGVAIPPNLAAELIPYDPSFGEFRVHYAGFLDPGFGYNLTNAKGTPVVLEVRVRDVRFLVEHKQPIARILYYELLEESDKVYGSAIGSSYQTQKISLGKQFR